MSTPSEPERRALELAHDRGRPGPGPQIIAVDGPSGSGKSTLAHRIAALSEAPVVHLDDLYDGWEGLDAGVDHLVERILLPLSEGRVGSAPRYDWDAGTYNGTVDVPAGPLVVVEGVGAGSRACAPYVTVLVWVEADPEEGLRRAVGRDGRNLRKHLVAWRELESRHHAEEGTRERADLLVVT